MEKLEYIPRDLVKFATNTYTIVNFEENFLQNKICYALISTNSTKTAFVADRDILPIPLTPEILEKNGWRTQNRWYYYLDVAEGFISYIGIDFKHKSNKGHLYVEVNGNNMVEIQYCHELQHFLFGLGLKQKMEV
jgi:hypothetical protein